MERAATVAVVGKGRRLCGGPSQRASSTFSRVKRSGAHGRPGSPAPRVPHAALGTRARTPAPHPAPEGGRTRVAAGRAPPPGLQTPPPGSCVLVAAGIPGRPGDS